VLEALESRVVLYAASGDAWPNPAAITLSFMPDGTNLGGVSSNLFSAFNASSRLAGQWQTQILKAAQSWAAQTNINLVLVPDDGAPSGSGNNQQGDPGFGDIRIGGYNFGCSTLARAYMPPPVNNFSIAGDIVFNTGQSFSIGSAYDLFTVAAHELGHALGLDHTSATAAAVMYPSYNGVKTALNADDIAGIRNIYSSNNPRSLDAYEAAGQGTSFATSVSLNAQISSSSETALVNHLSLTTPSEADYYTFNAPAGTSGGFTVTVQSSGLSLLTPKLTIYAANQSTVLATASGQGQYGTTLTTTIKGTAGQQYYAVVQGADSTVFSTGAYALALNFGSGPTPTAPSVVVPIANGNPISGGGGAAEGGGAMDDLLDAVPVVTGISRDTGLSSNDGVTNDPTISIQGTAPLGDTVQVYNNGQLIGQTLVLLVDTWSFDYSNTRLADATYTLTATSTDLFGYVSAASTAFTVVVDTRAPAAPAIGGAASASTGAPTFSGSAEPNSLVTLWSSGNRVGSVMATSNGAWTATASGLPAGTDTVTATATDLAGNVSAASNAFTIQVASSTSSSPSSTSTSFAATTTPTISTSTQAPTLALVPGSLVSGLLGSLLTPTMPTFDGTAAAGSVVTIYDGSTVLGTATADASGDWTFTSPTLSKGKHMITAAVTNALGTTALASQVLTITA
jgi:hypothetical protein